MMNTGQMGIIFAIGAYLLLMVYIGYYYSRGNDHSAEGFYLGGRGLGPLVAAMSAEASDMSSWLFSPGSRMQAGRLSAWRQGPT